jgi:hypothetical protein
VGVFHQGQAGFKVEAVSEGCELKVQVNLSGVCVVPQIPLSFVCRTANLTPMHSHLQAHTHASRHSRMQTHTCIPKHTTQHTCRHTLAYVNTPHTTHAQAEDGPVQKLLSLLSCPLVPPSQPTLLQLSFVWRVPLYAMMCVLRTRMLACSWWRCCRCVCVCVFLCVGLARTVYIYTVYDRMFGDFPARNTVYTPICMVMANPTYVCCMCTVRVLFCYVCTTDLCAGIRLAGGSTADDMDACFRVCC